VLLMNACVQIYLSLIYAAAAECFHAICFRIEILHLLMHLHFFQLVHFVNRDSLGLANDFLSLGFIPEGIDIQSVSDALQASFGDGTRQSRDFEVCTCSSCSLVYTHKKKKKKKRGRIYVNLYDVEALNSEPHGLMDFKESAMPRISFSSSAKLMLTFSLGFRPY